MAGRDIAAADPAAAASSSEVEEAAGPAGESEEEEEEEEGGHVAPMSGTVHWVLHTSIATACAQVSSQAQYTIQQSGWQAMKRAGRMAMSWARHKM